MNSYRLKVRKIREAQLNKGIVDMVAEQLLRLHFFCCFEYCGLWWVFAWDSRQIGVSVTLK